MRVCVFCSSSDAVAPRYRNVARQLGRALAAAGHDLVYGGGAVGLMGVLAAAVAESGGHVTGVIPGFMHERGIANPMLDDLVVTADMRSRKEEMDRRADAFIALPGGLGTCEEILEALTLKQLGRHARPVVFVNSAGFYDPLLRFFSRVVDEHFAGPSMVTLYHVANEVPEVLEYLRGYKPPEASDKWLETGGGTAKTAKTGL